MNAKAPCLHSNCVDWQLYLLRDPSVYPGLLFLSFEKIDPM